MGNNKKLKTKTKKVVKTEPVMEKEVVKEKVKQPVKEEKKDFWGKLGDFVRKSIDCCLE